MVPKKLVILGGFFLLGGLIFLGSAAATERCVLLELFTSCT
jgi:hypothetical protein